MSRNPTVLILESDIPLQRLLGTILRHHGFEPLFVVDGNAAVQALRRAAPAAILVDVSLASSVLEPGSRRGVGFLHHLQRERPMLLHRVVVLSGLVERDVPKDLPPVGRFLRKPFDIDELIAAINDCTVRQTSVAS